MGERVNLLVQPIMGQFPIYLSLTNLLVMFVPIKDGKVFEEEKYSKLYYYLAVIALFVSLFNYFAGGRQLFKKIIRYLLKKESPDETGQKEKLTYKDIEKDLPEDYSHHYPYFRVTKKIGISSDSDSVSPIRKEKIKELRKN